jgi:hypothetical protein
MISLFFNLIPEITLTYHALASGIPPITLSMRDSRLSMPSEACISGWLIYEE